MLGNWRTENWFGEKVHTAFSNVNWDGDLLGDEWLIGYAIFEPNQDSVYAVYTEDGAGNGYHLKDFDNLEDAKAYCLKHEAAGGFRSCLGDCF